MASEREPMHEEGAVTAFAVDLYTRAVNAAQRRSEVERLWYDATLQYQGLYDEDTRERLARTKYSSKLFANQTRPKTDVMRDRLIGVLMPMDRPNWDIRPTPVPSLQAVEEMATDDVSQEDAEAARAIMEEMKRRCDGMRKEISDQLEQSRYRSIVMKVIQQACKLGTGVLKGPFTDSFETSHWSKREGDWKTGGEREDYPRLEWVDLWDFYPDMDATDIRDCDFVFQLHRMGRRRLRDMGRRRVFDRRAVDELLEVEPGRTPIEQNFNHYLRHLKALEEPATDGQDNRYSVLEYHGPVAADTLREIASKFEQGELLDAAVNPDDPGKTREAVIWFCQDRVLKFALKPVRDEDPIYSVFTFSESDSTLFGRGIPSMIRDPQSALNASYRLMLDNAAISGKPMYVINRDGLKPADKDWRIKPGKVFYRTGPLDEGPAIEIVQIEGRTENLQGIMDTSLKFVDDESRLPLIAQGDQGDGARQTAHGMTLLVSAVNITFQSAARRFDDQLTIPTIRRLYDWNMMYGTKESIKGDNEVRALGSSVLLLRELQAQNMMMILNLVAGNPDVAMMVRIPEVAKQLFRALQIDEDSIVLGEAELQRAQEEAAANQPPSPEQIKMQMEQMKLQAQYEIEKMRLQAEMVKLATQQETTIQKISADLQKAKIETASKERLFAAETAIKARYGEGI